MDLVRSTICNIITPLGRKGYSTQRYDKNSDPFLLWRVDLPLLFVCD
jgi:hypothetical protein